MTRFIAAALVLAGFLLGGCVRSVNPVLLKEQVVQDERIVGQWGVADKGQESFEISRQDGDVYHLVYRDKDGKTGRFILRLGRVGALTIAELTPDDPELPQATSDVYKAQLLPVHTFFIVDRIGDELVGRMMKYKWFADYVKDHPKELSTAGTTSDNLVITATTAELQGFITKHAADPEAWDEPVVCRRPGDKAVPATRPQRAASQD